MYKLQEAVGADSGVSRPVSGSCLDIYLSEYVKLEGVMFIKLTLC